MLLKKKTSLVLFIIFKFIKINFNSSILHDWEPFLKGGKKKEEKTKRKGK